MAAATKPHQKRALVGLALDRREEVAAHDMIVRGDAARVQNGSGVRSSFGAHGSVCQHWNGRPKRRRVRPGGARSELLEPANLPAHWKDERA
jgi:hypothetical protein